MSVDTGILIFAFGLPMGLALVALIADTINAPLLKK